MLYLEGYLWDPEEPRAAMKAAIAAARNAGRKVAFTLSDAFVIDRHGGDFSAMIEAGEIDILFANEDELAALTQTDDFERSVAMIAEKVPVLVATRGPHGAVAVADGERAEVAAEPIARVVDTTGAGDLFAAGFLFGPCPRAALARLPQARRDLRSRGDLALRRAPRGGPQGTHGTGRGLTPGLTRRFALIDFEASCLPEYGHSFPIEVALATVDGASRHWLIRPAPEWEFWDWSPEAEALHGISRAELVAEGLPPARVLAELTEAAEGYEVYADADLDAFWLETLAAACHQPGPFPVRYLGELLVELGVTRPQVVEALAEARRQMPREHIARDDALRLALTLRLLLEHVGN